MVLNFFFQAEDGIRDLTVTGVQTCALPISLAHARRPLDEDHARGRRVVQGLRDRIGDGGEQTRLLGTRRHARREVREKVERVRSPFELGLASHRIMGVWRRSRRGRCCSSRRAGWASPRGGGGCGSARGVCVTTPGGGGRRGGAAPARPAASGAPPGGGGRAGGTA